MTFGRTTNILYLLNTYLLTSAVELLNDRNNTIYMKLSYTPAS